ncbi:MAG: phosphoglycolate phosphatase [Methanoregula sp.]|nr:phosphoglycolate phosphatase [Methanoregula sp.]
MLKALLTDVDGTLTDPSRRINTAAITAIRSLQDSGVEVVFASGNTACFMDALCKMLGTRGTFIAENGGVFRVGYTGPLHIKGDQAACRQALELVQSHYRKEGKELDLYSPSYRFADLAFARTVPVEEVKNLLLHLPVRVIDTGYAIHLQAEGVDKGSALLALAQEMNLRASDFLAIGDSVNDTPMLKRAGIGVAVANAHPDTKAAAAFVTREEYGDGFVEAVEKYFSYLRPR